MPTIVGGTSDLQLIPLGGTEASDSASAAAHLELLMNSEIGIPYGAVPLNAEGKVSGEFIPGWTLNSGDAILNNITLEVYTNQVIDLFINNYDRNRNYDISISGGTLISTMDARSSFFDSSELPAGNLVFFTSISLLEEMKTLGGVYDEDIQFAGELTLILTDPAEDLTITINSKTFPIHVLQSYINKPAIINLEENGTRVITDLVQLIEASPPTSVGFPGTINTIVMQIATDNAFTNIIFEDTKVGQQWFNMPPTIQEGSYYIRVRYGSTYILQSEWSDTISLIVQFPVEAYPKNEVQIIHSNEGSLFGPTYFGNTLYNNYDDTILIAGDEESEYVRVYTKQSNLWTLRTTIYSPNYGQMRKFGHAVAVLPDNQTILIASKSAANDAGSVYSVGAIRIYQTTVANDYTTLTMIDSLVQSPQVADSYFGSMMKLNDTGTKLFVGSIGGYGKIEVYDVSNNVFTLAQTITADYLFPFKTDYTFNPFDINGDGTRFVVGNMAGGSGLGVVQIYQFDGTNWSVLGVVNADVGDTKLGYKVAMSKDGNMVLAGNYSDDLYNNNMCIYVFKWAGGFTWNKTQKITDDDWGAANGISRTPVSYAISHNGHFIYVGTYKNSYDPSTLYIFKDSPSGYVLQDTLVNTDHASGDTFGSTVILNSDFSSAYVAAYNKHWNSNNDVGAVYQFNAPIT